MNDPEENEESEFRPCVGDLVMKGHSDCEAASCGVVLRTYEDIIGGRFYFVQMNLALILTKGPERLTQEEFGTLGFHAATKEEWQDDKRQVEEWYEDKKAKLYEAIQPFME